MKTGLTLVYEVEHYQGIFRSADGKVFDLRPNTETIIRPCLKTFQEMPRIKLQQLLLKAYESQLAQLQKDEHHPYDRCYEITELIPSL